MDCVVTPVKTLMVFSVHLNVQLKFYNLPFSIISKAGLEKSEDFSRPALFLETYVTASFCVDLVIFT